MSKAVFTQIAEGLTEALAVARGESEPLRTITTERHRGAPAKIGDRNAPQEKAPEER